MCGRYAMTTGATDLGALFDAVDETGTELLPDYNIAPTNTAPIVRLSPDVDVAKAARVLSLARWGLVPSWAADPRGGARMINARAETVASSRAFAPSFARRRCVVPVDGWYEWVRLDSRRKQPYFMTPSDGSTLGLAGIWARWGAGDQALVSFSIVTTAAVGDLARVHDRMPLTLPPDRWAQWLDHDGDVPSEVLLASPGQEYLSTLELRPVGPDVGDVRNDGPELVQRIPEPLVDPSPGKGPDPTLF